MTSGLGPVAESVFALEMFGRQGGTAFRGWRKVVRERLGGRAREFDRLVHERCLTSDLRWLLERGPESAVGSWPDGVARRQLTAAVFEFCQVAVVPYWQQVRTHLASVRDACGRIEIANGMQGMLGMLHPRLQWNPPVLEVLGEPDRDVYLDGRGLVLCPSLFLCGRPGLVLDVERETGMPALVFPVPADGVMATWLGGTGAADDRALSALVGHTRAAALQALSESCTTGELSQRLNISLAGASKHATVLRKAGLVTTARNRNTALHTLTPLGAALLRIPARDRQDSPREHEAGSVTGLPAGGMAPVKNPVKALCGRENR